MTYIKQSVERSFALSRQENQPAIDSYFGGLLARRITALAATCQLRRLSGKILKYLPEYGRTIHQHSVSISCAKQTNASKTSSKQ